MIFALFKECEEIYSKSSAVHCIENGISTPNNSGESMDHESRKDLYYSSKFSEGESRLEKDISPEVRPESDEKTTKHMAVDRRNLLSYLKE